MEGNDLKLYAYAPSVKESEKHNAKFPSLAVKKVTQNAINGGAFVAAAEDYKGNGYYFTRTPVAWSTSEVYVVNENGSIDRDFSFHNHAGACVGLTTIYDPESCLVKGVKKRNFTRTIFIMNKGRREEVTNKNVPIVKFGDHEYIWYNKEECESGENPLMDLVILEIPECARPFNSGSCNDYGSAEIQHEQYKKNALQGTSEEERKLLVLMSFSPDDGYEKGTPIYTKEQEEIIERVKASFELQN